MTASSKQTLLQSYQILLYDRALHPDLFPFRGRRAVSQGDYQLEAWVLPGQHVLRFGLKNLCLTELLTDQDRGVPQGSVYAFLCAGEKDIEQGFPAHRVNYMSTVQTETLSESLFLAEYDDMLDLTRQNQALAHRWNDEAGRCLSVIDIQKLSREVHVQAYHLIAAAGLVLRSQTIFEHR